MADIRLSERELARLLTVAGECGTGGAENSTVQNLLDGLATLVRCDVAFWNWYHLVPRFIEHALVGAPKGRTPVRAPLDPWLEHLPEHPIMSGRHGTVTMVSDVLRGRALHASWLYQEAWVAEGLRSEVGLELTHGAGEMSVIVLSRGPGPGFTEKDRLVLRLLRPHVDAAVRRLTASALLTPRERDVLVFVKEGLSNAQVARRLGIAEATVAKHLEHVFARTGTRTRLQAVATCEALLGDAASGAKGAGLA
jgi:DNA-binding CsgD family transcriptional regulator